MAVTRVKLLGTGIPSDPYRVNLPTFQFVLAFPEKGYVYVSIPDEDAEKIVKHASVKTESTHIGPAIVALDSDGHKDWHSHLDERYQEHKGKFRPEIA